MAYRFQYFSFSFFYLQLKNSVQRLTIIYIIIYIIVILNRLIFCKYASCSLTKLKLKLLKFFFREVIIFLAQFFFVSFFNASVQSRREIMSAIEQLNP